MFMKKARCSNVSRSGHSVRALRAARRDLLVVSGLLSLLGACASDGAGVDVQLRDPAICEGSVTVLDEFVFSGQPLGEREPAPRNLKPYDGQLYYIRQEGQFAQDGIATISEDGGEPIILVKALPMDLWPEPDGLYYAELGSELVMRGVRLMVAPLEGGPGKLVGQSSVIANSFDHALDASHLYWSDLHMDGPHEIWRMPRTGGEPELVATLDRFVPTRLTPLSEDLLVEGTTIDAPLLVAKQGGEVRQIEEPAAGDPDPLAGSQLGVLWLTAEDTPGKRHPWRSQLWTTPLDGGEPRRIASALPANLEPFLAAPNGDQGFIVAATERFDDDQNRISFWSVSLDDDADPEPLACIREPMGSVPATHMVASETAAFVLLDYVYEESWQLVRIDQAPR